MENPDLTTKQKAAISTLIPILTILFDIKYLIKKKLVPLELSSSLADRLYYYFGENAANFLSAFCVNVSLRSMFSRSCSFLFIFFIFIIFI